MDKISQHLAAAPSSADPRLSSLIDCVRTLSEANRRLLHLVYASQRKIKEVARELGQTSSATYVALFRIRNSLYECMEKRLKKVKDE
jgi:RNA polymerase sigma-70 factor (ECF subfamily)